MTATTKIIIAVVAVAVIAGGAWLLMGQADNTNTNGSKAQSSDKKAAVTITYTDNGFSPSSSTIKSGEAVTFVNRTDEAIEPASNPHPVHTDNPELNAGDIEPGESKTVTLTTKGTWGFHNHYDHDKSSTIKVE